MKDIFTLDRLRFLLAQLGITADGVTNSITGSSYSQATKLITFTRNDGSTFTVDFDSLQDVLTSVNTFADLPVDIAGNLGKLIIVSTTTGIIGFRKQKGVYYSNGTTWESARANFSAELTYYDNSDSGLVSVNVKTAIDELNTIKQSISQKNVDNGYAGLGADGKINSSQLPAIAITNTFPVDSEAAMLALTVEIGDIAVRTDINKTFILRVDGATVLANWTELETPTDEVSSVFGRTGVITAQNNDYTWAQIDKSTSSLANITTRNFSDLQNTPTTATGYSMVNGDFTGNVSATNGLFSGNVGIGTSTPIGKLDIANDGLFLTSSNISSRNWVVAANYLAYGDFALVQSDAFGTDPYVPTNSTVRQYTTPTGEVGINTTNPADKLDTPNIAIGGASISGTYRANALFVDNTAGNARFFSTGSNTSTQGKFTFSGVSSDGSSNTERMSISSTDVSIAGALNVAGTGAFVKDGTTVVFAGTGLGSHAYTGFYPDGILQPRKAYIGFSSPGTSNFTIANESATGSLLFLTSSTNRLAIHTNGNVGIGTSNPASKLHVAGTDAVIRSDGAIFSQGNITIGTTTTPNGTSSYGSAFIIASSDKRVLHQAASSTGGQAVQLYYNPNGLVGNISISGSSTSYNTSSDYRLKELDIPLTGAMERVKALRPINFAWKADGSRVDGFFAHELAEVVPGAATGTRDAMCDEEYEVTPAVLDSEGVEITEAVTGTRSVPDYQSIDMSKLVPLLTAAIKEQQILINTLTARIDALENN